jgi:hypothetical protein
MADKKIKIRIQFTVEIDPDAWTLAYGVEKHEIRDDVKSYIKNMVQGSDGFGDGAGEVIWPGV